MAMDVSVTSTWISRSSQGKQLAVSIGCAIAGSVLAIGFRDFGSLRSNSGAGFLLGLLLLVIGVWGLFAAGRQTVTIDRRARLITIEDARLMGGRKERAIPFDEVLGVTLGFLGKRSNFVKNYHLVLRLRSGETCVLFAPGRYFDGSSDRQVVESWRDRLLLYLGR